MNSKNSKSDGAPGESEAELRAEIAQLREENALLRCSESAAANPRSDESLRQVLAAANLGTWDWDLRDGSLRWSERCREMHEIAAGEALDHDRFLQIIHREDRVRTEAAELNAIYDGGLLELEYRCVASGGAIRWIASIGRTLYDDDQRPLRVVGVAIEITSRKKIEAALRASEAVARARAEELETLMDTAPAGIFVAHDRACRHVTTNRAGMVLTRTRPGDPLTVTPADGEPAFPYTVRSGGLEIASEDHPMPSAGRLGKVVSRDLEIHFPDGLVRYLYGTAAPLRAPDGNVRGVIGTFLDVTEQRMAENSLRSSEALYRVLTELSPQIVWTADAFGVLDFCNQNWLEFSGLTFGESINRGWLAAVHPDFREPAVRGWERSMLDGRTTEMELPLRRHDGVFRWHLARTVSIRDSHGKLERWIGIAFDIDERRRSEDALRQHERELRAALVGAKSALEVAESSDRAKDQFLAVLSHELRTPLTPVLMAVSALQLQPGLPEPMRDALQMIRRNIALEANLIDDLLDLTRIARGTLQLALEAMDVHEAVRRALEICAGEIGEKSHRLTIDLAAKSPLVQGDFARLQQVFWNLIKNAVKFTPASGEISIRSENAGGLIRIQIADSGIGIAPEALTRIFNPFEQGSEQVVRQFGGLGLGLAISRATIDAHGGRISATSPGENRGAIFTLELTPFQ